VLSIQFDAVTTKTGKYQVHFVLRALANVFAATDAVTPVMQNVDIDTVGTIHMVGRDYYATNEKNIYSPEEDVVGYSRNDGNYGRLITGTATNSKTGIRCDGGNTEQSLAIFSPDACGVYGYKFISLTDNGTQSGAFRVESAHGAIKLYAHSAAFLEVASPATEQTASQASR
jgi:hypothetical protein